MTRVSIRHGGLLKCAGKDESGKPCSHRFYTYSILKLVRTQAAAIGWTRQIAWHITGDRSDGRDKADCCPEHTQIAKMNNARRKELIAADIAARRAVRAQAWAKKQQDWAEARTAKANKKAARAARLADRANANAQKAQGRADRAKERFEDKQPKKKPPPAPAPMPEKPARSKARRSDRAERQADTKAMLEKLDASPKRQTALPTDPREEP